MAHHWSPAVNAACRCLAASQARARGERTSLGGRRAQASRSNLLQVSVSVFRILLAGLRLALVWEVALSFGVALGDPRVE